MIGSHSILAGKTLAVLKESQNGLTFNQLYRRLNTDDQAKLNSALEDLVANHKVYPIIQIVSPNTSQVIAEYDSLLDIPSVISDESFSGEEFFVDPVKDVTLKYQIR